MNYINNLFNTLNMCIATDNKNNIINFDDSINDIIESIMEIKKKKRKIIVVGNGGSAAIASHMVNDFLKGTEIFAITFSDYSVITCLSNDYGYEKALSKAIEIIANKEDLVITISSSGNSQNILNAAEKAKNIGCKVLSLSGFQSNNKLRQKGDINIYIPSNDYGIVELSHQIITHMITDKVKSLINK